MHQDNVEIIQKDGQTILKRYTDPVKDIAVPKKFLEIGNYEFTNCYSIGPIKVPDNVKKIDDIDFIGWSSLSSVELGPRVIPEGVTVIGDGAFKDCKSHWNLVIPKGVIKIGNEAFKDSNLTNVVIPKSVKWIADDAFDGCQNLTIHAPKGSKAEEYAKENGFHFEAK